LPTRPPDETLFFHHSPPLRRDNVSCRQGRPGTYRDEKTIIAIEKPLEEKREPTAHRGLVLPFTAMSLKLFVTKRLITNHCAMRGINRKMCS